MSEASLVVVFSRESFCFMIVCVPLAIVVERNKNMMKRVVIVVFKVVFSYLLFF